MSDQKKILVVDDEPDLRDVIAMSLMLRPTWSVTTAASGYEAIEQASTAPVDLILLDVMMPELDGPATFARLAEQPATSDIPVVFLTAKARSSERAELQAMGVVGVISKPFDPMTLADDLSEMLDWAA